MTAKRKIADFLCAFTAFAIVLLSIAALTGEVFFEDAVRWNGEEGVLSLFGTDFNFDKNVPKIMHRLVSFNDILFAKGFTGALQEAAEFFAQYIADGVSLAYRTARMAVGAE